MKPETQLEFPVHPLIEKRWSPRAFADKPLGREVMFQLFEAARWAASSYNEQPWRFIFAFRDDIAAFRKLFDCLSDFNQEWVKSAPALMLVLAKKTYSHNKAVHQQALHDVGLAMGNLSLQATSLDLYVHSMGGFDAAKAREVFNIPDDFQTVTMVAVGYLGKPDSLPEDLKTRETAVRQRKPLSELVFDAADVSGLSTDNELS